MKICPHCKRRSVTGSTLGEVCINPECGYLDGMDFGPRKRTKKVLTPLERANKIIHQLEKRIWDLEHEDHCCDSCGNVTRPSHPADGC